MQSNNLHHKNTFDAARGRRRRVIGHLRIGGSLGIWKKPGLLPKLNFNQYVYRVRNAEEAMEDLGLKSPCMYPVVVFSTMSQKVGPGRLTCAMAWLFALKAVGLPTNPEQPSMGESKTQATLVLRRREKRGK